ncbi:MULTISPECIES: hypothetical protein [unclassified Mycobacterium]|uniref:hypothetical protein n=1 Tax=unclassified Mycobacterium TaxID=2642494 RepID=UPI00073FC7D7|nr:MULTISPECIES: hypothetical protein [unclassified Mycobacterium]KUH86592.1 hypothetical protein AU185_18400 [Mycobacterium sp. GA-0227b]KUH88393.1 hypothetical protein AU187_03700 [Mycobacterium sp. IS-1556]KUH91869.1 hypothetical protein AU186_05115 [Mycobacterium sp. GA-1999]
MTLPFAPAAVANDRQAVITESGKVRCYTNATGGGHGGGSSVVCQRRGGEPFAQSPYSVEERSRLNLAAVSENGDFYWDIGNIPWSQEAIADDIVLKYGQTYHVNGWTILSTFEGTRFTNDRTGHGMFVSVDDVYGF